MVSALTFVNGLIIGITTEIATLAIHSEMLMSLFKAPVNLYFDVTPVG